MFDRQIERLRSMFQEAQEKPTNAVDSVALISTHVSRPKTHQPATRHTPKYDRPIARIKQELSQAEEQLLDSLFRAKCKDLAIGYNASNW